MLITRIPVALSPQARGRVDQLRKLGHSVDKVEFILMGGTFMSLPSEYRDYFVRNLHDALSGHSSSNVNEVRRTPKGVSAFILESMQWTADWPGPPRAGGLIQRGEPHQVHRTDDRDPA